MTRPAAPLDAVMADVPSAWTLPSWVQDVVARGAVAARDANLLAVADALPLSTATFARDPGATADHPVHVLAFGGYAHRGGGAASLRAPR